MTYYELAVAASSGVIVLGGVVAFRKWVSPKVRRARHDVIATRDAILGRDATLDTITGRELAPALPGIGQRVASAEENISTLALAMTKVADTHHLHAATQVRLDGVEERLERLEKADHERAQARTESIELLRTIDSAIRADPKPDA